MRKVTYEDIILLFVNNKIMSYLLVFLTNICMICLCREEDFMEYLSLFKANYINDIDEKKLYKDRFNSKNTVHFPINIHKYSSFLCMNEELMVLLQKIQSLNTQIIRKRADATAPLIRTWELYNPFVEEIISSNEIEGVVSTRKEITELINIEKTKEYKRFYGMVKKYEDIFFQEKEFTPISNASKLRELYNDILLVDIQRDNPDNIPDGVIFRKEIVNVVSSTKTIHRGLYPESKIIEAMNSALSILNDNSLPYIVRAAVFHYFFGYIHPFYDGNGRLSRYISSHYLSKVLDPIAALRLSIACKNRQKDYYEAFKITNDVRNKGDITYFVLQFLDILKTGLKNYLDDLTNKVDQYHYYKKKQSELDLVNSSKTILEIVIEYTLFYLEPVTLSKLVELTNLSKSTVSNRLSKLEKDGLVEKSKHSKNCLFYFKKNSL